jgi:molybdenum cofactor cytidylyltransferase
MLDTAAIVLAAGSSSRMGRAKQMLELDGLPLVRRAAAAAIAVGCSPVVVVLGARAWQIAPALEGVGVVIAVNPDWHRGIGSSIATGIERVERSDAGAALITLADQPLVGPATLERLLAARRVAQKPIAAARYAGTTGVPACFTRALFPLLRTLDGGHGCKALLRAHPHDAVLVDCPEAALDLDTPEDYARLLDDRAGRNVP